MRTKRSRIRHLHDGTLSSFCRKTIQPVEQLEGRLLFATVTVCGFTQQAIQAAINQSQTGDTIYFPAGTYALQGTMFLPGHRTYQGQVDPSTEQSEAIFTEPKAPVGVESQVFELDHSDPTNVVFTGLEFDGAGLHLDYVPDHITIEDCTFANQTNAPYLIFTFNLTNSTIENNFFINDFGPECMMMYDQTDVQIVNNYFDNVNEGMHLWFNNPAMNTGINISNNDFHCVSTKAVEIQGATGNGLTVSNNIINDYNPSLVGAQTFCMSIVPYAYNVVIAGNQLQAPSTVPFGIEVCGYGTVIENNDIRGTDEGIVLQSPSENCIIKNNTLEGQRIPIVINSSPSGLTLGHNGRPLVSASLFAGSTTTGSKADYDVLANGTLAATQTTEVVGPATFDSQSTLRLKSIITSADGNTSTDNLYASLDSSLGFIAYGQTISSPDQSEIFNFSPEEIEAPASLVAGRTYIYTCAEKVDTVINPSGQKSESVEIFTRQIKLESYTETAVNVSAGIFQAYKVVETLTEGSTTTVVDDWFTPGVGLIKSISSTNETELTSYKNR
jgi:parallel beta-helix repeat protein